MSEADRVTKLEERYAHLQRHQTEQDKAMLELSEEIVKLRKEISLLRGQATSGTAETRDAAEERPPHY
jgi:SlyX protein